MITLPTSDRETSRVQMVSSFGLLDRPRVAQHDEIATLASELAGTSQALVSLVESERNWFSGGVNFADAKACRWASFCTHAITQPGETLWVENAAQDFRFADNPYVVGEPHLRFYAGVPIVVNGHAVGTLCVFDGTPRPLDAQLISRLSRLAKVVAEDLATRHRTRALQSSLLASADALIDSDDYGVIIDWSEGARGCSASRR